MTIASQTSRISYTGDGSTTAFAVPFFFSANADLVVYLRDPLGNSTLQSLGSNYSLSGATLSAGGTCTFTVAPTSTQTVVIYRDPPITQTASYNNNDPFPAKSHEGALDKATTIDQRTRDMVLRSLRLKDTDAIGAGSYQTGGQLISGVANGVAATDAATKGQVDAVVAAALAAVGAASTTATQFASRAAVMISTINVSVSYIRTAGYYAAGDGGGALYKRTASQPAHALWVQSADGAYWVFADTILNVLQAGAKNDGTYVNTVGVMGGTDNTTFIQNALDAHTYYAIGWYVFFPPGMYRTTKPLHCGYGVGGLTTTRVRGPGKDPVQFNNGASILCDFYDGMGVNHQGCRNNVWQGVNLVGHNWYWVYSHNLASSADNNTIDDTVAANWIDTLLPQGGSRYAPYAGMAFDAYSGPQPAQFYPAVTYPAFLGTGILQYNKAISSDVLVEDTYHGGWGTGFVAKPSGSDGNGDFVKFLNCVFENCQFAISISHTQSRSVYRENCLYNGIYCVITNNQHGMQNGAIIGPEVNGHGSSIMNLMQIGGTSVGGPLSFLQFYCEGMWRIGSITGSTSSETSVSLIDPKLDFANQTIRRGVPAKLLDTGSGQPVNLRIEGGYLNNIFSVAVIDNQAEIDGMGLAAANARPNAYEKFAHNATAGGLVNVPGAQKSGRIRVKFSPWNVDTAVAQVAAYIGPEQNVSRSVPASVYTLRMVESASTPAYGVWNPAGLYSLDKSTLTAVSTVNLVTSFTMPAGTLPYQYSLFGPSTGDVLIDAATGTVWFVKNVNTTTGVVLAVLQNNIKSSDAGVTYSYITAPNFAVGTLYVANSRLYTPTYATFGDITAASAVIANVGRADGYGLYLGAEITTADRIYADSIREAAYPQTASNLTVVTQASPGSLTMGGNAGYTQARKRLEVFARSGPANIP